MGHEWWVNSVAWSPDGTKIASGSADHTIIIWDIATGTSLETLIGHTDQVNSVVWSPNGRYIASGSSDKTMKIWDVGTGKNLKNFTGHNDRITSISWNPDGETIASGSWDKTIKIWDVATGTIIKTLIGHRDIITSVQWSPDGKELASGSADQTIKIWGETLSDNSIYRVVAEKSKILIGDSTTIIATIINNGAASANNTVIKFYDGSKFLGTNTINLGPHDVENSVYRWVTGISTNLGEHNIIVIMNNSEKNISVFVNPRIPNLYVSSLNCSKNEITIGDNISINAIIANNGTANASNADVKFYVDTILLTSKSVNITMNDARNISYQWQTTNKTLIGWHNISVESGTNWENLSIFVKGKPNIFIANITVNKKEIIHGESIAILATVANNGTADAPNVTIIFYDGDYFIGSKNISVYTQNSNWAISVWDTKNVTSGKHILKVVVGTDSKEINVIVKSPIKSYNFEGVFIFIVIIILFLIGILNLKKGIKREKD